MSGAHGNPPPSKPSKPQPGNAGLGRAEKLLAEIEANSATSKKFPDLSVGDMQVLLSHPLLAGLVKDISESGGSHLWMLDNPFQRLKARIGELNPEGMGNVIQAAQLDRFIQVPTVKGKLVKRTYVQRVCILIWAKSEAQGLV